MNRHETAQSDTDVSPLKPLQNQSGFALIIIALAAVLAGLVTMGNMFLLSQQKKTAAVVNLHISAAMIRSNVMDLLQDDTAWNHAIQDTNNTTLACLRTTSNCGPYENTENRVNFIYDRLGNLQFQTDQGNEGWTPGGESCAQFDAVISQGSLACPFRYEVYWRPNCTGVPGCQNPPYQVEARLVFSIGDSTPFNTGNYGITLNR